MSSSYAETGSSAITGASMKARSNAKRSVIKLVVWDLDNTLWRGILLEGDAVRLRSRVPEVLATLDQRGILHSIASKNDSKTALEQLRKFDLDQYFLHPQINWNSKAASIRSIAGTINIGIDAVAFIDDDPFEREEVRRGLPEVLVLDAVELDDLLSREEFIPRVITEDSAQRRQMYRAEVERKNAEDQFIGPTEEFLASLDMKVTISPAREKDLLRAEELTIRANQLNATGCTYSYDELDAFRQSPGHILLIAGLEDKFGSYGKIGLVLLEKSDDFWTIKLLLMSCRVVSRGVGTLLINQVLMMADRQGARLRGEFRPNGKNRMMFLAYKFAGFREVGHLNDLVLFEHDMAQIPAHPSWVQLVVSD